MRTNTQAELVNRLLDNAYGWFKSLPMRTQMDIADEYRSEQDINDNIIDGFIEGTEEWLVGNYNSNIKDYIILNRYK